MLPWFAESTNLLEPYIFIVDFIHINIFNYLEKLEAFRYNYVQLHAK